MMLTIPIKPKREGEMKETKKKEEHKKRDKKRKEKNTNKERRKKRRETVQRSFEEHNLLGDKKAKEMYMF
jgi:hypothetical protein